MAATFVFLPQENSLTFMSLTEEEMVIAANAFCGAASGMVGNGLSAMVATRVQTIVDLYRCLATPEPGFYEHPMQFDAGDGARFMEAGAVAGNCIIVTACFLLHFLTDLFMSKTPQLPLPRLFARAGWILYIILTQATISFCCRMYKHASTGGELAAAVIVFLYWLALLVVAFIGVFNVKVRWLPFGAGASTAELTKIYPELTLLPAGAPEESAMGLPSLSAHTPAPEEMQAAPVSPNPLGTDEDGVPSASAAAAPPAASKPKSLIGSSINNFIVKAAIRSEALDQGAPKDAETEARRAKRRAYISRSRRERVFLNRPLLPGERRAGKWVELYEDSKDKTRFGVLFDGLRPGFRYFILIQLCLNWIYGIIQGAKNIKAPNQCEAEAWTAAILIIIEATACAALQPSRFISDNFIYNFITATNMAAGAMLVSRRQSGNSEYLVYVAVLVVTGMMLIKAIFDVYGRVSAKMSKDYLVINEDRQLKAEAKKKAAEDARNQQQNSQAARDEAPTSSAVAIDYDEQQQQANPPLHQVNVAPSNSY